MNTQEAKPLTHSTNSDPERLPDHRIYKPNSRGTGGVFRFGLNRQKQAVFLEAAPQIQDGERKFDWDAKIIMKWGLPDLGGALTVLRGQQDEVKLFHQSEHASSSFRLIQQNDPEKSPYLMNIGRKDQATGDIRKVTIPLSQADAIVLQEVFTLATQRLIAW